MEDKNIKYCPECGSEIIKDAFYCSNCGYSFVKRKKQKKSKVWIILLIIFAFVCGVFYFVNKEIAQEQARIEEETLKENVYHYCVIATYSMLDGAAQSEKICNEICDVWHNSIWKVNNSATDPYTKDNSGYFFDEFDDALNKYSSSDSYISEIKILNDNYSEITRYMSELRNTKIPETLSRMYDEVEELYDLYIDFYNMPIRMDGSYNSFSEDFGNIDNSFMNKYDKVCTYITK